MIYQRGDLDNNKPVLLVMQNQNKQQNERKLRMYSILLEILQARGYVIDEKYKDVSASEFENRSYELQRILVYKDSEDGSDPIGLAVHMNYGGQKVTENFISNFLKTMGSQDIKKFLIVAPTNPKNKTMDADKNAINMAQMQENLKIELFRDQDLLFNVLKHDLVPEHIVLSDSEKADLLEYYKVKETQLPKLLSHDPVARFLGLHRGQVVKIIRKSQTAGTYTTYRVVI